MTTQEQQSIVTLVLMAAFTDGSNAPAERAEVQRVADSLSGGDLNVAAVYQDVLLKRVSLDQAVSGLTTPDTRRLAYELCVGVCDADGAQSEAEKAFLASLHQALGLDGADAASAAEVNAKAEALALVPLSAVAAPDADPVDAPGAVPPIPGGNPASATSTMSAEEQDRVILNYAILNGALEILPDSLATMAIIPLQMKLVYRIGQSYGYDLDRGHIKDFLATAGVGLASQYIEQVGVKIIGGIFGRGLVGGLLGGLAKQTVSSGFSFATTYALGKLAVRYYAGGRTLSTQLLKDTYASLFQEAKGMQGQYGPAIRERARTVNVAQILQDVRQ